MNNAVLFILLGVLALIAVAIYFLFLSPVVPTTPDLSSISLTLTDVGNEYNNPIETIQRITDETLPKTVKNELQERGILESNLRTFILKNSSESLPLNIMVSIFRYENTEKASADFERFSKMAGFESQNIRIDNTSAILSRTTNPTTAGRLYTIVRFQKMDIVVSASASDEDSLYEEKVKGLAGVIENRF